jgi:hypothetical protein
MPTPARYISRFALTITAVLSVLSTGCDRFGRDPQRTESAGEIDRSFEPARIKSIKGVPAAEVRTAIDKRLDGGRPKPITETQWGHAKKLYESYDGNPLWLDGDGLRERRSKTLMTALLNADAD